MRTVQTDGVQVFEDDGIRKALAMSRKGLYSESTIRIIDDVLNFL